MVGNGYRITENGDQRVIETLDLRITERYYQEAIDLAGTGSIGIVGALTTHANTSLSSNGTLTATAHQIRYGASLVANNSVIVSNALVKQLVTADLAATGSTISAGKKIKYVSSSLAAVSTFTKTTKFIQYANFGAYETSLPRITEASGLRITETGDTRITGEVTQNAGESTLLATASTIPFSSTAYVKRSGSWIVPSIQVKHAGTWKLPTKIHRKTNGLWKRIY